MEETYDKMINPLKKNTPSVINIDSFIEEKVSVLSQFEWNDLHDIEDDLFDDLNFCDYGDYKAENN